MSVSHNESFFKKNYLKNCFRKKSFHTGAFMKNLHKNKLKQEFSKNFDKSIFVWSKTSKLKQNSISQASFHKSELFINSMSSVFTNIHCHQQLLY